MGEVSEHVLTKVRSSTQPKQTPKQIGDIEESYVMARTELPGIALAPFSSPVLVASRDVPAERGLRFSSVAAAGIAPAAQAINRLNAAIAAGALLPGTANGVFSVLDELRSVLPANLYASEAARVRVTLEDRGEQVLLQYLKGEQVPQTGQMFEEGAALFRAAAQLAPESLLLESRALFCEGRALIFTGAYDKAIPLLERAIQLDPVRAYSYNALGIAYLERAQFVPAIAAFRDAIRRAPFWPYPLLNVALAYSESGDFRAAVSAYQLAMRLAPSQSFIVYNLGLLYQRLNRRKEAEASYRRAMGMAPERAEAYIALGYLKAEQGRRRDAEELYKAALVKDPSSPIARHNLASLLASDKARSNEAIDLWRQNLAANEKHLPSLLGLARQLARSGESSDAITQYEAVLKAKPDYLAARIAYAELLAQAGQTQPALHQFEVAAKQQDENLAVHEWIGDLYLKLGDRARAIAAWTRALELAEDGKSKKRLRTKLGR